MGYCGKMHRLKSLDCIYGAYGNVLDSASDICLSSSRRRPGDSIVMSRCCDREGYAVDEAISQCLKLKTG